MSKPSLQPLYELPYSTGTLDRQCIIRVAVPCSYAVLDLALATAVCPAHWHAWSHDHCESTKRVAESHTPLHRDSSRCSGADMIQHSKVLYDTVRDSSLHPATDYLGKTEYRPTVQYALLSARVTQYCPVLSKLPQYYYSKKRVG